MAEVMPVRLGVKSKVKNRGLVNVVKKQSGPSCAPAHSTELGYSLSTTLEADVSLSPQGGENSHRAAWLIRRVAIVNCDPHAELSDWVRWV